jgi:uncharacterized membrane protein
MKTESNSNAPRSTTSALILSFIIFATAIILKCFGFIGDAAFISLVVISVLVGFIIQYFDSIQSFSLLKGELILKDIKETESSVKELAKAILEVTETSSHGLMLESFDSEAKDKAVEKLRKLTT